MILYHCFHLKAAYGFVSKVGNRVSSEKGKLFRVNVTFFEKKMFAENFAFFRIFVNRECKKKANIFRGKNAKILRINTEEKLIIMIKYNF